VAARTTSGSIVIGTVGGKLSAHDAGGDIKVAEARDVVTAETTSGSLVVNFSAPPRGECRLSVAGGGIRATLPSSSAVDLDAKAMGGSVVSDLPVTASTQSRPPSSVLSGKINGGGPPLVLRASAGDIHLKASAAVPVPMKAEDEEPAK